MPKIGFFTPVSFGGQPKSCSRSLLEKVDSYFSLGGKKACVISGHAQEGSEGVTFIDSHAPFLSTALKIVSYFCLAAVIPAALLALLITKVILRSTHRFHLIEARNAPALPPADSIRFNAQQKLEEGIDISPTTLAKIRALLPKILGRAKDPDLSWYYGNNLVFSLASVPGLIFKTAPTNIDTRFANMVKAQEVCLTHRLGLLVIPHAKRFTLEGTSFIAEERIRVNQNESAQEGLYKLPGLNEAAKQLAIFIAKTGLSDVAWRNMPVVDTAPEFQGPRRVALLDLEEMEGATEGIFGGNFGRRGLVQCLSSEEQIDMVIEEARRQGVSAGPASPAEVKADRMGEIQLDQELHQFYVRNGILENPRKLIQVGDLTSLGLDLDELEYLAVPELRRNGSNEEPTIQYRQQPITLREAVTDVIAQINDVITKTPEDAAVKGKRHILLSTTRSERIREYTRLGLPKDLVHITRKEENQTWLRKIINALVAKGHLFKLDKVNGHGYFVQA